jgi:tRNA-dihydrouridine synthase
MVQSLVEMGVSGVMMGRPALGNPAIFDYLKNELGVNDPPRPVPTLDGLKREYDDIYEAIGGSEKHRSRFLKVVGKTRPRY